MSGRKNTGGRPVRQTQRIDTSAGIMSYMTTDFLKAVKKRPTVYNFTLDDADDGQVRLRRHEQWKEIARELFPNYNKLPENEQQYIAFVKLKRSWKAHKCLLLKSVSLKQAGDPKFRPYIFRKEMDFFIKFKCIDPKDTRFSDDEGDDQEEEEAQTPRKRKRHENDIVKTELNESLAEEETHKNNKSQKISSTPYSSERLRQRSSTVNCANMKIAATKPKKGRTLPDPEINEEDNEESAFDPMVFCQTTANGTIEQEDEIIPDPDNRVRFARATPFVQIPAMHSMVDESADQAFFESIRPSLRKMSESQKLDFKIEVLQLLKKYQNIVSTN